MELISRIEKIVAAVQRDFAPDLRLAVYDVAVRQDEAGIALVGATSVSAAAEELHRRVGVLDAGVPVRDEVMRLPAPELGELTYALVRAAVAPLLAGPLVSEAIVTQAVLGQRLTVLRQRGRWLQCRGVDGYLGWVHRGYLHRVDHVAAAEWEMGAGGESCFSLGAAVLDDHGEVRAHLPWGARVLREPDGSGRLPDGALGRLVGEVVPATELAQRFPLTGAAVVASATRWIGTPYLWGGITPAGVDCSGLVQAVYRLHGLHLPRDSDLQALVGEELDPGPDFAGLQAGDLLFFAEDPGRISHVTLSLGGSRVLHASLGNAGVARNDLAGSLPYEQELRRLFIRARRVIPPAGGAPG